MKLYLIPILLVTWVAQSFCQIDSSKLVRYNPDFQFRDGIYLNFLQVKMNSPISKAKIISSTDYNSTDFFNNLVEQKTIQFYDEVGSKQEVKVSQIWGYCHNGRIIIQWNGEFNRIPYLGNICHFVSNKTIESNTYNNMYNPYGYYSYYAPPTDTHVELHQYILDFETGSVYDYELRTVESLLVKDATLYDEFMQLRTKKRRDKMFFYIRKFNEKHPLFVSK